MTNAWYPHYPGDYARDTGHLSMVQQGAYRLLLDHYYATEAPLPADFPVLYRLCRAFSREERKAVDFVLSNFFELQPDGYHNKRADIELAKAHDLHERRSRGGRKTAEKRWRANSSATRSATSSRVGNPQPQPQPQPPREEKKEELAPSALVPLGVWLEFVEMRKKLRKPMTQKAAELIHKELAKLKSDGHDPVEVLEQSIRNGWQDVFPLKEKRSNGSSESFAERHVRRAAEELSEVRRRAGEVLSKVERGLPEPSDRGKSSGDLR